MDRIRKIIDDVASSGDAALIKYTEKFDGIKLEPYQIEVNKKEWDRKVSEISSRVFQILEEVSENIRKYSENQKFPDIEFENNGIKIIDKYIPVDRVGVYVPGGKFCYPSTVLMSAIPARVAGVKEIYVVSPPGNMTGEVLSACRIAGVRKVFRVGGPQAVAALACGTETVPKVDMIVGPGNKYVQQAKHLLSDKVGIDIIAGPSEVVIIADGTQSPDWIAADLIAQLEHSDDAQATLITDDEKLIEKVRRFIPSGLPGRVKFLKVKNIAEAVKKSNSIAPEHLQIMCSKNVTEKIRNAGAVFIGKYTPVAVGDYWAGPSHTLPTGGTSRFSGGLNVRGFLKKVSFIECTEKGIKQAVFKISEFAKIEGMEKHSLSILKRKGDLH